jgi:diaminopimelate epimerase
MTELRCVHTDAHGNDFLIALASDVPAGSDWASLARIACARAGGGADGLLCVDLTPDGARMQLRNADGSYSEVSGNGVRCLGAWIAVERDLAPGATIVIATDAGEKVLTLLERDGRRCQFRASMGEPRDIRRVTLDVNGEAVDVATLNVGNPQCVVLGVCDDSSLQRLGRALAVHPHFPEGTNVELLRVVRPGELEILIWERGVGPTASSGTGTCAAAVAAACFAGARRDVVVRAPGGSQRVEWQDDGLWLIGWAEVGAPRTIKF